VDFACTTMTIKRQVHVAPEKIPVVTTHQVQRAPRAGKYKLSGSLFATANTLAEPAVQGRSG